MEKRIKHMRMILSAVMESPFWYRCSISRRLKLVKDLQVRYRQKVVKTFLMQK